MYTTREKVAEYMGQTVDELPNEINKLISAAGELIDYHTLSRTAHETHREHAEAAVLRQVEYWLSAGEDVDILGSIQAYSVMSFSVTYADGSQPTLAPRAKRYLLTRGLMSRSVGRY